MTINAHENRTGARPLRLTPAESHVLLLLPTHLTLDAIAARLGRRRSTVKTHVAHIYEKLGANTRDEAVSRARETGFLADPRPSGHIPSPEKT
ncbi:MAG: response regulator transcription factor [Gaiellaceae bacterium]